MTPAVQTRATLDDLMREEGKAELIGGRIVRFMATGHKPSQRRVRIFRSLRRVCRGDTAGGGLYR